MIVNICHEDNGFYLPDILLSRDRRFKVSFISIRCSFENPMSATKFLCLRTNLVDQTEFNPHQIIAFFTVKRNVKYYTFNISARQPYKVKEHNLSNAGFMICEVGRWNEEVKCEKGVLQIFLQTSDT